MKYRAIEALRVQYPLPPMCRMLVVSSNGYYVRRNRAPSVNAAREREGDIAVLMEQADALGHPVDWLIRSQHNRNLAEAGKLWDKVEAGEVLGEIAFILPRRAGQKAREVRQELRASRLPLPVQRQPEVTCVVARETGHQRGSSR